MIDGGNLKVRIKKTIAGPNDTRKVSKYVKKGIKRTFAVASGANSSIVDY